MITVSPAGSKGLGASIGGADARLRPALAFACRLGHKAEMVGRGKDVQQRLRAFQGQLRKLLPLVEELLHTGQIQEANGVYAASQEAHDAEPAEGQFRVERYKNGRHFALYDGGELLGVMVYRKGAETIRDRLQAQEARMAERSQALRRVGLEESERPGRAGAVERLQEQRKFGSARRR